MMSSTIFQGKNKCIHTSINTNCALNISEHFSYSNMVAGVTE
jgi:hypothetical protein